jgi:acetyl esterase
MRLSLLYVVLAVLMFASGVLAQSQYHAPGIKPDKIITFKEVPSGEPLELHVFLPDNKVPDTPVPVVVLFFGGGWTHGNPDQMYGQCDYFAKRGLVAISPRYRTSGSHGTTVYACIEDGKSAIRWVREHAGEFGIDPDKIAVGGASAGGYVAAAAGTVTGFDAPGEKWFVSAAPNAMILFNPAVNMYTPNIQKRVGAAPFWISPLHQVRPDLPPTIIFHGTKDTSVPHAESVKFRDAMQAVGNTCELHSWEGLGHGFFRWDRDPAIFSETLKLADEFLQGLGWL